jgi:uncharacterized protein
MNDQSNAWEKELIEKMTKLYFTEERLGRMLPEHDLNHAMRVKNLCIWLVKKESLILNQDVLIASALLHDIGYISNDSTEHINSSVQFSKELLPKVKFKKEKIPLVLECIKNHDSVPGRVGWKNKVPIECKILRDADAIESLGYLGIIRFAMWGGRNQTPIYSKFQKPDNKKRLFPNLDLLKNIEIRSQELITRCFTKTALEIMKERTKTMKMIISGIQKEINFAEKEVNKNEA